MAEEATASQTIRTLIDKAHSLASSSDPFHDDQTRVALLGLSQQLAGLLMQPDEAVAHLAHGGGRHMCVRVADDLGLFDLITTKPRTAHELAVLTGADEYLIVRLMRMMVATGFAAQEGHRAYSATPVSKQMTIPSVRAGVRLNFEETFDVLLHTPNYLKANGYRLPRTMTDTPFQYARHTHLDNHKYWAQVKPETMEYFQTFMNGLYGGPARSLWWRWFPIHRFLESDAEVAFVDIAGGRGHDVEGVLRACPEVRGRFVLQDLPEVIAGIQCLDPRIERVAHDFLTPQPATVKGATVFFLSNIFHDHPVGFCRAILSNIKPAMAPAGASKLLISNIILPEDNAPLRQLDMDISMFFLSGGAQRTEAEWSTLLEPVGFKIVKFWYPPGDQNGIIEAELV